MISVVILMGYVFLDCFILTSASVDTILGRIRAAFGHKVLKYCFSNRMIVKLESIAKPFDRLFCYINICIIISSNPQTINYRTVLIGFYLQFLTALFVLRTSLGYQICQKLASTVQDFMNNAQLGGRFFFDGSTPNGTFVAQIVPIIIFFSAFISAAYHIGLMNYIVVNMSRFMIYCLDTTGPEP